MQRTVAMKMGLKEGSRAIFIHAPKGVIASIKAPRLTIGKRLAGAFDYIHAFVETETEFPRLFASLRKHLASGGSLWVSWPKSGQLGTDLNMKKIIKMDYDGGLVESTCLSIDPVWSGIKFTHPKKGKVYKNSHGKLKVAAK